MSGEKPLSVNPTLLLWGVAAAIIFYQLKTLELPVLMALMLLSGWFYVAYPSFFNAVVPKAPQQASQQASQATSQQASPMMPLEAVEAQQMPRKGFRYLEQNPHLKDILNDLRFTTLFDKGRFLHLQLLMNQYQKAYMYLLGKRRTIRDGIPIFYDLQDSILELLYSLAVNVPVTLKHTYGLTPHDRIHRQIETFLGLARTMTTILENFSRIELNEPYFPEWIPRPFSLNAASLPEKKHVLP